MKPQKKREFFLYHTRPSLHIMDERGKIVVPPKFFEELTKKEIATLIFMEACERIKPAPNQEEIDTLRQKFVGSHTTLWRCRKSLYKKRYILKFKAELK